MTITRSGYNAGDGLGWTGQQGLRDQGILSYEFRSPIARAGHTRGGESLTARRGRPRGSGKHPAAGQGAIPERLWGSPRPTRFLLDSLVGPGVPMAPSSSDGACPPRGWGEHQRIVRGELPHQSMAGGQFLDLFERRFGDAGVDGKGRRQDCGASNSLPSSKILHRRRQAPSTQATGAGDAGTGTTKVTVRPPQGPIDILGAPVRDFL